MRCSVLNCYENSGGYCMSASYIEIDADGTCDTMHLRLGSEAPKKEEVTDEN